MKHRNTKLQLKDKTEVHTILIYKREQNRIQSIKNGKQMDSINQRVQIWMKNYFHKKESYLQIVGSSVDRGNCIASNT